MSPTPARIGATDVDVASAVGIVDKYRQTALNAPYFIRHVKTPQPVVVGTPVGTEGGTP
jgi:hypothetical protein